MDRQKTLWDDEFFADLAAKRHARRTDPATSHQSAADIVGSGRLSRQCDLILTRLRRGPACSLELAAIAIKYSGRISDLRARGYTIEASHEDGVWFYTLKED